MDACATLGGQFDDIIVNEGQDFTDDYLAALIFALKDEADAQVWIFLMTTSVYMTLALRCRRSFVRST